MLLAILRAANIATQLRWVEGLTKTLGSIGFGFTTAGLPGIASRYLNRAQGIAERFGDRAGGVFTQMNLGTYLFSIGRWSKAEEVFEEARLKADQIGDLLVWADVSIQICEIWNETADFSRVLELSDRMITRGQETAYQPALRWGKVAKGKALRRSGRPQQAHAILADALQMCLLEKDMIAAAASGGDLAMGLIELGHQDEAEKMLAQLRQQIVDHNIWLYTLCDVYVALAELAFLRFRAGDATSKEVRSACAEVRRLGRTFSMGRPKALRLAGRFALLSGRPDQADRIWRRAIAVAEGLGAKYELALIRSEHDAR